MSCGDGIPSTPTVPWATTVNASFSRHVTADFSLGTQNKSTRLEEATNENDVVYFSMDEGCHHTPHSYERAKGSQLNFGSSDKNYDSEASVVSTVLTAEGIADPVGFYIVCLVAFISDMARGIFFPVMWQLVKFVGGNQVTLGYVIASFSFGRMLVLPLFGSWSTKYGYRYTMLFSCGILVIGTLLIAQASYVRRSEFLIFANSIVGVGSGTLGVTIAYVSDVTPKRDRTKYMAWVTSVQYAGTAATPFLGALFVVLCSSGEDHENIGLFAINEFSAPAYFMTFITLVTICLLCTLFQDIERSVPSLSAKKSKTQMALDEVANARVCFGYMSVYDVCLIGCMILNGATKGPMSCFETFGIEFAESHFHMERAHAGMVVATMGCIGSLFLLSMGTLSTFLDDTQLTSGGILVFVAGILMNTTLNHDDENPHWRYWMSMFLSYGVGYPLCHAALIGMFSKIVGRRPQGTLQGWFSASGSISRISFPIIAGYIVSGLNIETLFMVLSVVLGLAIMFIVGFRETLIRLST